MFCDRAPLKLDGTTIIDNAEELMKIVKKNFDPSSDLKLRWKKSTFLLKVARDTSRHTKCYSRTQEPFEFINMTELKNTDIFITVDRIIE